MDQFADSMYNDTCSDANEEFHEDNKSTDDPRSF